MVAALLGCLIARRLVLLLDAQQPAERSEAMLPDAGATGLLCPEGSVNVPAAELPRIGLGMLPGTCRIDTTYASTEAGLVAGWVVPAGSGNYGVRVLSGYLVEGVEVALLDPIDGVGELVVRGRGVALGEWQNGECVPGHFQRGADRADRDRGRAASRAGSVERGRDREFRGGPDGTLGIPCGGR
jgi:non-ribosomal peptide synthetase component F